MLHLSGEPAIIGSIVQGYCIMPEDQQQQNWEEEEEGKMKKKTKYKGRTEGQSEEGGNKTQNLQRADKSSSYSSYSPMHLLPLSHFSFADPIYSLRVPVLHS